MTARLTLIQWLSPAFPTGAFVYSHGLEQAIADGAVRDAADFRDWLAGVIEFGAGWQDSVLLALSLRDGADHAALADLALALSPSQERLRETAEQGAAFARTVSALTGREILPAPLPVAIGRAAQALALPAFEVIALALHAFASNLVTIATRAVPLGQTEGQGVLAALHPLIAGLAERAAQAGEEDLGNAALCADLQAMRHETLETRLFRT
ncbi:urease accessory protein UreF [Pseudogemmobacter sonorensis]|uniref:urease accessory protein UreF n=1 Tax=Pseudogemmobacter sonorensis TaxID=2989681 RepID=UPI0036B21830